MKTKEIQSRIEALTRRSQELSADNDNLAAQIEAETARLGNVILEGKDPAKVETNIVTLQARQAGTGRAIETAAAQIEALKTELIEAQQAEAREAYNRVYPVHYVKVLDACQVIAGAAEDLKASAAELAPLLRVLSGSGLSGEHSKLNNLVTNAARLAQEIESELKPRREAVKAYPAGA